MKAKPIGIDLGTTYSAVATINDAGKAEIIPNEEGERTTASVIYFNEDERPIVGNLALDRVVHEESSVIRWVKREMGNFDFSFKPHQKKYSAIELSAIILKEIMNSPIKRYPNNLVTKVVITVPAYFDEIRRSATMKAAKLAGLEVLQIINEPTAAALAYANASDQKGKTLIYDLGGGTFDVTVVDIESKSEIKVLSSEGDHQLGGYDIDLLVATYFAEQYSSTLLDDQKRDVKYRTIKEAEHIKKALSKAGKASTRLDDNSKIYDCRIDLERFNELISEFITRTEMLVETAIAQAVLSDSDIENIILVGGSTRIPAIQEMLKKKFNKPLISTISQDEAVALGAALLAGMILSKDVDSDLSKVARNELSQTELTDVATHSFGTVILDAVTGKFRNKILIPKNSSLPCSKTDEFMTIMDNQVNVNCVISQGEDEDPEFVNIIANEKFELPSGRPAGCKIRVTYIYDKNGRMSCQFYDIGSGQSKIVSLDLKNKTEIDEEEFNKFNF